MSDSQNMSDEVRARLRAIPSVNELLAEWPVVKAAGETCDAVVGVLAPPEVRVQRIMAREGISEEYARMRVAAQKPSAWFQEHCDYTLESTESDTVESFSQRAQTLFREIIKEN